MRMATQPGVTNLVDILNNPNGIGGQKPAPDPPPPSELPGVAVIQAAKSMQRGSKPSSAVPQVDADPEELRICVVRGVEAEVQFYLDDGDDYEKVIDFEVDLDTARKLIPFFKEIANVRILHKELKAEFPPPAAKKRGSK